MSPNPEQFSLPEEPNDLTTAGDDPNKAGHLSDIPYDKEPLGHHYKKDATLDTGQLTLVQSGEYRSPRPPARELPVEKKNKTPLFIALGLGAVGVATAVSAWVGATGNGLIQKPGTLPESTPSASAPLVPGGSANVETPTAAPTSGATSPVETQPNAEIPRQAAKEDLKFRTVTGEVATFEELSQEHKLLTSDYQNGVEAMRGYLEVEMPNMIEYFPNANEVRKSLSYSDNKVLTKEDYLMAAAIYRQTYDIVYDVPAQGTNTIYTVMNKLANIAVSKRYDANTGNAASEAVPFDVTIDATRDMTAFTYSDNLFTTTPDTYGMSGKDPQRTTEKAPAYKIDHNIKLRAIS
jgi:hypothetical protein